jgi:nucleoside recognition membrane protein YjiH
MRSIGIPELLIAFILSGVFLVPACQIARKAGYPAWYGLIMCVPGLNILAMWWFAFSDWPNLRRP